MTRNDEHVGKTAQIWRAGGMIWLIFITTFFFIYDLYMAKLPIFPTTAIAVVAFAITFFLSSWCLKTLGLAKKLPDEQFIDPVKRRRLRKRFFIVLIIEIAGFNIAPFVLLYFNHIEYIVPVAILICAIHFIPLARIFSMPVYYWLGCILSVITILTIGLVPVTSQAGNLMAIAAIPSISFIVLNWLTITYILNDAMKYLVLP
jgi:hypothetical protein